MRVSTRLALGTLLVVLAVPVGAQTRQWGMSHTTVGSDTTMAEYTQISTTDGLSPQMVRVLYKDSATGALLVMRSTSEFGRDEQGNTQVGTFSSSVTLVSTGEQIVLSHDTGGTVTVTIGTGTFTYSDTSTRPLPQSVKDQARAVLLGNASPQFLAALERFTVVGARFAILLFDVGFELADLFFPNIVIGPLTDHTRDPVRIVIPFDPSTTPPCSFEEPFGQHYHQ